MQRFTWIIGFGAMSLTSLAIANLGVQPVLAEQVKALGQMPLQAQENKSLLARPRQFFQVGETAQWTVSQGIARITGVELNRTSKGLQIILKTAAGSQNLVPLILPEGNNLVIDILDATLGFSIRNGVTQTNPSPGIKKVNLAKVNESSIRLTITGDKQAPSAKVVPGRNSLVLSIIPGNNTAHTRPDEEIEIVVTGQRQDNPYVEPNASTATRTDTPQRDIPQAIQVIPEQIIKDQGITRIEDALRNAVGVTQQADRRSPAGSFNIRGFESGGLRNGFDFTQSGQGRQTPIQLPNNIQRVEVLRGPDSVLNGSGEPGGSVNYVTKQPQEKPFYSAEFTAGQFDFYQPAIDLTGSLTEDKKLLYRLTAAYQSFGSFLDFVEGDAVSVAPAISYRFGEDTALNFNYEYSYYEQIPYSGLPLDPIIFDLPNSRNFNFTEDRDKPNGMASLRDGTNHAFNLDLEHEFNDTFSYRSELLLNFFDSNDRSINIFDFDSEFNELGINFTTGSDDVNTYSFRNNLISNFNTGLVEHKLLFGVDWTRVDDNSNGTDFNDRFLDIFNPDFSQPFQKEAIFSFESELDSDSVGIYLQDQVTLLSNLKLLVGGRYDIIRQDEVGIEVDFEFEEEFDFGSEVDEEAFSPRVGVVYQPIKPVSLYANFNRSFEPNNATTSDGELVDPERGTQYEIGIKNEFGKIAINLALYNITKTNVLRTDPDNPDFEIAIGEIRSRGIELDVGGEIMPGWNITASTFFNDSEVTEGDEDNPEGDTVINAPGQGASLWTTYEIQKGSLKGLGLGGGLFYVGDIEAELPNDFVIPSYVRADASLFYRQKNWNAQLNFVNLFDNEYFEGSVADLTGAGAPFTVLGKASVQF